MDFNVQQQKAADYFLLDCDSYEDYLETFVSIQDLRFLRNISICRKIVELGYRTTEILTPAQFEMQKEMLLENSQPTKGDSVLYGVNLKSRDPLLIELAAREKLNHQKTISTIIFLSHRNKIGFEVSGFIDFKASLTHCNLQLPGYTNWEAVFEEVIKLRPKVGDLSYYDIHKGFVSHNNSENYIVRHDIKHGLTFLHRGDHKKIFVDNTLGNTEHNYLRSVVYSPKYGYVVLFDHIVRKKM